MYQIVARSISKVPEAKYQNNRMMLFQQGTLIIYKVGPQALTPALIGILKSNSIPQFLAE